MKEDEDILPKVGREDVVKALHYPEPIVNTLKHVACASYNQGTNGLYYQQLVVDLPDFDEEELLIFSTFCKCFAELGFGDKDYLQVQMLQSQIAGGIGASYTYKTVSSSNQLHGHFVLSAKALSRNSEALNDLMFDTFKKVRFNELERLRELHAQIRSGKEQSITGNGHALAMMLAASSLNESAQLSNRLSGLAQIQHIKTLDDAIQDQDGRALEEFAARLSGIQAKLCQQPLQLMLVAEERTIEQMQAGLDTTWQGEREAEFSPIALPKNFASNAVVNQMWSCNTQVNFCAKAFPAVNIEHQDAPALTVLGGFLKNGFLHKNIREQGGAYGGGAGFDAANRCFRFYSYRDPRLAETLNDFDASIDWMLNEKHPEAKLEEAVLGVISDIDKPSSPAGEAKQCFHSALYGRTADKRRVFREQVLSLAMDDLKQVSERYLANGNSATAVIGGAESTAVAEDLGLKIFRL